MPFSINITLFQFHKVRLKEALQEGYPLEDVVFQFHKVRLKERLRLLLVYVKSVSIP